MAKRKDSNGRVLKDGEYQRNNGTYEYRWCMNNGKRRSVYAKTLDKLRIKEDEVLRDKLNGFEIADTNITICDLFDMWSKAKRGIKESTYLSYTNTYKNHIRDYFCNIKLSKIKKSTIKTYYNELYDKGLSVGTIKIVNNVLMQLFDFAAENEYINANHIRGSMKELSRENNPKKVKSLTVAEQNTIEEYLENNKLDNKYRNVLLFMLSTGVRIGEALALRWGDIDFDKNIISISHTLSDSKSRKTGERYIKITKPKTKSSIRIIPMISKTRKVLLEQKLKSNECESFVFARNDGKHMLSATVNSGFAKITHDCNKDSTNDVKVPTFTSHVLRHTFATRMCEASINIKVIQDILGHSNIQTTLNIYTDATSELKQKEILKFESYVNILPQNLPQNDCKIL